MFEEVKAALIKQLKLEGAKLLPESKIKDDLGADSIDTLELLMTMEEEYGITIPDEKLAAFVTVQDVADYLETRLKND